MYAFYVCVYICVCVCVCVYAREREREATVIYKANDTKWLAEAVHGIHVLTVKLLVQSAFFPLNNCITFAMN